MQTEVPLQTLIVEDCEDDVMLLVAALRKGGFNPDFVHVDNREALGKALHRTWDVVFSDYSMPAFNGHEALHMVRAQDKDVPFIFVSGTMGEDLAVEAMRLGAQDYFVKGNLKRLAPAVNRELRERVTRRLHREAEERIQYLANYDALTGLPNRTKLMDVIAQQISRCGENNELFAVFTLNIDRFRNINDHLGAAAGDSLLTDIANRLAATVHSTDTVARLSVDEFAVVATRLPNEQAIAATANTIFAALAQPFVISRYEWRINISMGSSVFPQDGLTGDDLIANSAMALHHAKRLTGNSYQPYTLAMRTQLHEKLMLERALEQAIDRREFHLHYQPQVAASTGRITSVEALIRWQRPGVGLTGPDKFIPAAEESGLIVPIGEWVLREACGQLRKWQDAGLPPVKIAINLSAYQFRQKDIVSVVGNLLQELRIDPHLLEFEITETALMHDAALARSILMEFRRMGISIALDDFGTGYSSLSYLKQFPVDVLKIDRKFVSDLPADQDDAVIVQAIIAIAEKLKLQVVAEGVETGEQLEFLKGAGCPVVQGYHLHRPSGGDELTRLLRQARLEC